MSAEPVIKIHQPGDQGEERHEQPTAPPEALLWSVATLAKVMCVSTSTVYHLLANGRIGPRPINLGRKCVRFVADECRRWIAARCPPRKQWEATAKAS